MWCAKRRFLAQEREIESLSETPSQYFSFRPLLTVMSVANEIETDTSMLRPGY